MSNKIRLHLGCGTVRLDGYINIDLRKVEGITDLIADCRDVPFEKESVDEIISFHLFEHFDKIEGKKLIKYWYDLLKPGGKLIIECPNIITGAKQLIEVYETTGETKPGYVFGCHDRKGRENIPNDFHKFGYSQESLKELFEKTGFKDVISGEGTDYHAKQSIPGFCIRCEGVK